MATQRPPNGRIYEGGSANPRCWVATITLARHRCVNHVADPRRHRSGRGHTQWLTGTRKSERT